MKDEPKGLVLTGGASGIGAATAVLFAETGYDVVFGYYPGDTHDPTEVVGRIESLGHKGYARELDVRSTDSVESLFQFANDKLGSIDAVVANAGILRNHPIETMTDDDWYQILDVDLTGIMRVFRAASRSPKMRGSASLVAVSSITGAIFGWAHHAHYAAAKAGVRGLVRSLAVELGSRGIRVNSVIPGLIRTPQSLDDLESIGDEGLRRLAPTIPLERIGAPEDIAGVIRFLCSDDAAYVTAAEIVADGGISVKQPE